MIYFSVIIVAILTILLSYYLFGKWVNHLSIYTFIWSIMICLYQLRLLAYVPIYGEAWTLIIGGFLSYFFGILTVFTVRNTFGKSNNFNVIIKEGFQGSNIFSAESNDNGLKYAIWILALIGLLGAMQHWKVLLDKFGSVTAVLLKFNMIYRLRIEGEIPGVIPYVMVTSYAAVFLAGIYTAKKYKLTLTAILPFIAIILKEIANVGRAGILFGLFEFAISFFLSRYLFSRISNKPAKKRNIIVAISVVLIISVGSFGIVRSLRGTIETFQSATRQLNKLKGGFLITPSLYLYGSSHIGVFSKYLEEGKEKAYFGENTLTPVYNLLSKFELMEHTRNYQRGYFIPVWTNTGTYLREIHADFGTAGVFIFPYLMGLLTTFFWFRFFEKKKITDFIILVYLFLMVAFSFLTIVTRLAIWPLSLLLLLLVVQILERKPVRVHGIKN